MPLIINASVADVWAKRSLADTQQALDTAYTRIGTGKRINKASDDIAGYSLYNRNKRQISEYSAGLESVNTGNTMLNMESDSLFIQLEIAHSMLSLAQSASTGSYTSSDLNAMQSEFASLLTQTNNQAYNTTHNDNNLLRADGTISLRVGTSTSSHGLFTVNTFNTTNTGLGISSLNVSTTSNATSAISTLNTAINALLNDIGTAGGQQTALAYASEQNMALRGNLMIHNDQIMSTDYAAELAQASYLKVVQQAAIAVLAQSSVAANNVLSLLKNMF
jgi:flagellin